MLDKNKIRVQNVYSIKSTVKQFLTPCFMSGTVCCSASSILIRALVHLPVMIVVDVRGRNLRAGLRRTPMAGNVPRALQGESDLHC